MTDPSSVPGEHDVFLSGDHEAAKARVAEILRGWFGWRNVVDLGDIMTSRAVEAYLLLWVTLRGRFLTTSLNVHFVHAKAAPQQGDAR